MITGSANGHRELPYLMRTVIFTCVIEWLDNPHLVFGRICDSPDNFKKSERPRTVQN